MKNMLTFTAAEAGQKLRHQCEEHVHIMFAIDHATTLLSLMQGKTQVAKEEVMVMLRWSTMFYNTMVLTHANLQAAFN